ncbi:MAG TPA: VCBS repeat-containing protein [Gemmataceae bacterium]|nr:VCBS repeat-containing protein [Gemmataceae bacterium]
MSKFLITGSLLMHWQCALAGLVAIIVGSASSFFHSVAADAGSTPITWKKTHIDKIFRSEGAAVADVNKDGKLDIIAGDVWYEAPDWKMHEIRKPGDYGDGVKGYSNSFACFVDDFNGDGWPDVIVIGFPGKPCHWYENPKGEPGHWKEHLIWRSACNETPQYVDLFGDGKRKLIMAIQPEGQMCWFQPGKDPTQPWEMHPISQPSAPGKKVPGTDVYSHGLGVGDVNGDGRLDVICTGGWWEQPARDDGKPWIFHACKIGEDCADMYAFDMDGAGKADIISSSAHLYGIWAHKQLTESSFQTKALFPKLFSQTHALNFVDINGDGLKDLVTGKRWWAHGPTGDADPNLAPVLYWFEAKKDRNGMTQFMPHQIDADSGIGTQFVVTDVNGDKLPDIVIANKKGVFLFEQVREKGK